MRDKEWAREGWGDKEEEGSRKTRMERERRVDKEN